MRICFCLNGPNEVNGPNVWLTRHLPLLRRLGARPELLYCTWHPRRRCRFRATLEAAGIPCRVVRLTRFVEDNAAAIVGALRDDPPDVFVPNYTVSGYFAARFLREAGVVTVGTLHSDDPYYRDILEMFALGRRAWRLDAVVGVSTYLQEMVARASRRKPIRYLHAPYGAPVPSMQAKPARASFGLVYAGRIIERQKRVLRVTASMIAAARADPRVSAVLLGGGPELAAVKKLIRASTVRDRVVAAGPVAADAIQGRMVGAHVFVLLSDFEGLSIALMEAMACGLVPIVSRMRSGVTDVVIHGHNGFVIDPDDTDGFVALVRRLAESPGIWQKLSRRARATIVQRGLTAEACARAWLKFLKPIVAAASPGTPGPLPHADTWDMPPRSARLDGIRSEDRRSSRTTLVLMHRSGRPIYLWGASRAGEVYLDTVRELGVRIRGFIDSDPRKQGLCHCGHRIHDPARLADSARRGRRPFIVITSLYEAEISRALKELGFVEEEDFVAG